MASPAAHKARNLERVRLNQQRSRERKREYITQLEAKVAELNDKLKAVGNSATTTATSASSELIRENNVRRHLLEALGISLDEQNRFIRLASRTKIFEPLSVTFNSDTTLGPLDALDLQRSSALDAVSGYETSAQMLPDAAIEAAASNPPTFARYSLDSSILYQPSSIPCAKTLECICPPIPAGHESLERLQGPPPFASCAQEVSQFCETTTELHNPSILPEHENDTTACSIALDLVLQNNRRGYSFPQLEAVMRTGYRKPDTPYEGCRILNKVLFHVLAQIA